MYARIALIALSLWCAGCTQGPSTPASGSGQAVPDPAGITLGRAGASRATPMRGHSFANLPDRGDLVAYPAQRVVRHDGAYTWHRAGLSEEHAMRAVGGGVMHVTTPAGGRLQFQYERHVEHPSGDWTWIGRAKGGAASDEIVLTFGEKATFGTISQPGQAPLKLTMAGGVSWLIETDRSRIAGIDNPATRPRKPDFLIPPKSAADRGASADSTQASATGATGAPAGALAAATTTVDLLLGYTAGFAAAHGGQSQAATRLNNLVEITNQAYVNSQVDARVRLVHMMQVSYADNTDNGSALEALTGFRAPSTRTTPDPAFAALRSAREQYGADLVSLVRDFNSPENDGCGIAWLIGGGQTGIDISDESFGYSVVSDGSDPGSDGKTYFCREETLAHELGHNMGSQHDRVAATVDGSLKYGVYPYSFGYKPVEGAGGFYTVMAYGDTGQTSYRTFSNPRSVFCGAPCGIENDADNARSLGSTIPLVAAFRASIHVSPPGLKFRFDLNADGKSDLLWYRPGDGSLLPWTSTGSNPAPGFSANAAIGVGGSFRIIANGDFDGDGRMDLVWNRPQGDMQFWRGDGFNFAARQYFAQYPAEWTLVGTGDIDGDGRSDLIWHRARDGLLAYWIMNGPQIVRHGGILVGGNWRVLAVGDFNGDGRADLIWTRPQGDMQYWQGDGTSFAQRQHFATYPAGWNLLTAGDVDGDGRADLLWHRPTDGLLAYWVMNGPVIARNGAATGLFYYQLKAGDYNGDNRIDLAVTSSPNSPTFALWSGDGAGFSRRDVVGNYPVGYDLVTAGD